MSRVLLTTVLMAICLCETTASGRQASPSAPKPAAQAPAFRAGVDVVSLSVTVTDGMNHYVTDLEPGEFVVFEDGIKQDITFFNRRQQPIALSLLLDSSASMEEHLPTLKVAATNFVKRLKTSDIAQVIDFDSRVEIRQAFTSNHGCYVFLYDRSDWQGAGVVLNGPAQWPKLEGLYANQNWRNRIQSVDVGPAATVTVYTDAAFSGLSRRFAPNTKQPRLDSDVSARIESLELACRQPTNGATPK